MRQDFGFLANRLDQPKLLFSSLDFTISRLSVRSRLYHESETDKQAWPRFCRPRISLKHYGSGQFEVDGQVYQPYMPEETIVTRAVSPTRIPQRLCTCILPLALLCAAYFVHCMNCCKVLVNLPIEACIFRGEQLPNYQLTEEACASIIEIDCLVMQISRYRR